MPPAEIIYRVQHQLKAKSDQFFLKGAPLSLPDEDKFEISGLIKFAEGIEKKCLSDMCPQKTASLLAKQADQYLNNRITIFGREYDLGRDINWHLELKANKIWPKVFWKKVNIRDGFTFGAPKFVWELNRLYGLPILGLAFKITKRKEYADKILQLVDSWLEDNHYPCGVNWTSGIEIAVRVANLIWALFFLKEYDLTTRDRKNLNTFFYCHAHHLFRYPSKYSSNNNHAIAEAFGLFLIGVFFPFYEKSYQWRQYGQRVLERECLRQILPDGGSYEYSTTYLSFVFDFFLLFKIVCDNQGISYSPELDRRLEKSCEYIYTLMDCEGNLPNIGDQDSAVLVNFGLDNHENFQSILNTGHVLFGKDEFKRDSFPDIKTWVLVGERIASSNRKTHAIKSRFSLLAESGLGVMREMVDNKEVLFIGNATPLGMPPLYGHGHLDALSIYLSIKGKEILVDPGTYLYHGGGEWRRYFRSTAAHNTLRINRLDLTEQVADFMFGKPYAIIEHSIEQNGNTVCWKAKHDAYRSQDASVILERKIVLGLPDGNFEVQDTLEGQKKYYLEQFFHFHPQCQVELDGNRAVIKCGDLSILFIFDAALQMTAVKGCENPLLGWFSKRFNHIEPCWTVIGQTESSGKQKLNTKIILAN